MAEMDTSSGGGGHKKGPGVKKSKKSSTRVDLTPMVDLGFLLITFFVFTTSISKPVAMRLILPDDGNSSEVGESSVLNIIVKGDNGYYYYEGGDPNLMNAEAVSLNKVRDIIINKKRQFEKDFRSSKILVVLLKLTNNASYKDVIDALDEMTINTVGKYMILDSSPEENSKVASL